MCNRQDVKWFSVIAWTLVQNITHKSILGDSGVRTLGDTSAFVFPAGQLLLIAINSGLIAKWRASA